VVNIQSSYYISNSQTASHSLIPAKFGRYIGITLFVHISHKRIYSLTDETIMIKLYTAVVYNLRMWMKDDSSVPKNIKGDNLREIIICAGQIFFMISIAVLVLQISSKQ